MTSLIIVNAIDHWSVSRYLRFGHVGESSFEFFIVCTKLAEMTILYSKDLTTAKKTLPPVGLDLVQEIIAGLGVQLRPVSIFSVPVYL